MRFLALFGVVLAVLAALSAKFSPLNGWSFEPVALVLPPVDKSVVDPENRLRSATRVFAGEFTGPESMAWDASGALYMGVWDGRIVVKRAGEDKWADFVPPWAPNCTGRPFPASLSHEEECGRVLGLRFDPRGSGDLYFADAYKGLCRVGPEGGAPTVLSTEAEGVPFRFADDLDIDAEGNVYFTDASDKYPRSKFLLDILEAGANGRLLKYDPVANATTVLARGLRFPNGVALSQDQGWLAVTETTTARVHRFWLRGPKAGSLELLADLPGCPDNIRADGRGAFWVGVAVRRNAFMDWFMARPWVRTLALRLPVPLPVHLLVAGGWPSGMAVKISEDGSILRVLEDKGGHVVGMVSEVEEREGKLWLSGVIQDYMVIYDLESGSDSGSGSQVS